MSRCAAYENGMSRCEPDHHARRVACGFCAGRIRRARTALLHAADELRLAAVLSDDGATITVHHCPRSRRAVLAKVPAALRGFPVVLARTPERERRRIAAENGRRP